MSTKRLLATGALAGAAVVVVTLRRRDGVSARAVMARRMRQRLESMPEDFPPRVMFDNLAAIRRDVERILEIVERDRRAGTGSPVSPSE